MSDRVDFLKVGTTTTRLTLAVELIDTFTGEQPEEELSVSAADVDTVPARNPSGFHLFLDLPNDPLPIVVDGGDGYFDLKETIDPTELDPPAAQLNVTPSPGYRFPPGATLLRGFVVDDSDNPVGSATVSIRDTDEETVTDENGEFVLFIKNITPADVHRTDDGTRLIRINGDDPEIHVAHPNHGSTTVRQPLEEGSITRYNIVLG